MQRTISVALLLPGLLPLALAACGQPSALPPQQRLSPQIAKLSRDQRRLVADAVKQIVEDKGAARMSGVKAINVEGSDKTQVCGYVTYLREPGKVAEERFFVELGVKDGVQVALRGQVSSDPARSAKVNFMCRHGGLN